MQVDELHLMRKAGSKWCHQTPFPRNTEIIYTLTRQQLHEANGPDGAAPVTTTFNVIHLSSRQPGRRDVCLQLGSVVACC